ncbi:DUF4185 domain-containing protein [Nocardioides marmoriginsengisoli]|uniref:DUF4185 domain-containing protein n=1 Tax=Nocardioides marmoriginsengisoli TaxID=661483 RepID=A0A3N0CDA6_9ACTN|nr:DUF4185 domain-containing protein [Nocardioides marmoriginsengisoli]RNL61221.1 DUF4185 domain-containing protein [Nocardioides marmoriginsengisoli]
MLKRRWRIGLLVLAVALVAVVAALGARPGTPADPAPEPAFSLDCLPFTPPTDVAALNRLIAGYRSVPGFVGADVGADVTLSDGRTLWVFGDTLRQPNFDGQRFVRNSMLMFSPGCATVVMPKDRGAVVPDRGDGVGYWPMDLGVVRKDGFDLVGVSLQRVRSTGPEAFDFEILGPAIALFRVAPGAAPELQLVRDLGRDDPDSERPMWGAAVETVGSTAYIYGTAQPGDRSAFGWSLQVARAPITAVTDPRRWRYWDGRRWQRDPSRAAVLIPAIKGVSEVLSVFHRGNDWYAVSKRDEMLGTDLVIWKAPSPTGPFVAGPALAQIPSNEGLLRYMPLAHPDLLPDPDSLVVSYSRNTADLSRLLKDPDLYRPHFLQVPLPVE